MISLNEKQIIDSSSKLIIHIFILMIIYNLWNNLPPAEALDIFFPLR